MALERPKVGIGVIVMRDGKILLGERLSGHGSQTFCLPGGHLEGGESFEECARREVEEETGLKDLIVKGLVSVSNDIAYDKHYVSLGVLTESHSGEPINAEPNVTENWKWYDTQNLPNNIFVPSANVIKNWLNKQFN
jgi:8-oxo-dGTP diphosphatase